MPLQEVLRHALDGIGLRAGLVELSIRAIWDEVVGEQISRKARPDGFKGGRLYVLVEDSIWLHQLSLLKPRLIASLNERLGTALVKELYLRIGTLPPLSGEEAPPSPPPIEAEVFEELLAPVRDLPCREAIRRLLHRALISEGKRRHPVASLPQQPAE